MSGPNRDPKDPKAQIDMALLRFQNLLLDSGRLLIEYSQLIDRGLHIIDKSRQLIAKKTDAHKPNPVRSDRTSRYSSSS
jgi:hypothetical protein